LLDKPDVVIVGEIEAGRSAKVRKSLESLLASVVKNTFDVAELLSETKSKGYYSAWGFDKFKDYVATLDIKSTKAYYLVRIVDVMNSINRTREQYEPMGLSKLREIASLNPEETYKSAEQQIDIPVSEIIAGLVDKGTEMSLEDIKKTVREVKGLTGENELVFMNFSVKSSVKEEIVKPALELAKMQIGSSIRDDEGDAVDPSDGAALEVVCVEFLNNPANQHIEEEFVTEG